MNQSATGEDSGNNRRGTIYFICIGIICVLPTFQLFGPGHVAVNTGIHMYWTMLVIFAVIFFTMLNIYKYILSETKEIVEELRENKREILRWIWRKIKQNWRPLLQLTWDFVKENIVPVVPLLAQHIKQNFRPAVKKIGNYLAAKFRAVGMYIRTTLPVAIRNLMHDLKSGFSDHMVALWVDLMNTLQYRQLITQLAQGIWNGTTHMLKQAKDQLKVGLVNLGSKIKDSLKRNIKRLGQRALNELWGWAKSDWKRLTQLLWKYLSPRWRRWLEHTFRFMRDELNEHPQVQNRLQRFVNGVRDRIVYATSTTILLLASSYFLMPSSYIKALLNPNYGSECHRTGLETDIHLILTPGIPDNQWKAICTNLGVDTKVLSEIQLSYKEDSTKKETCLGIFARQETACWEKVVLAVCDSPFYDPELSNDIATKMNVSWTPLEQLCGSRL